MKNTRYQIVVICVLLLGGISLLTYKGASQYYLRDMAAEARSETSVFREILQGWLGRYRALPSIYAEYQDLAQLLVDPSAEKLDQVNQILEGWNSAAGASDIYLLDKAGTTIAASNWNDPVTFVGQNYAFRPYYKEAMQGRLGRFFALGVVSGTRGYYFSHPVRHNHEIIGVVVVKLPVREIELELRAKENDFFVVDEAGVVVIASHPEWRLKLIAPLEQAEIDRIEQQRQFSLANMPLIDIENVVRMPDDALGNLVRAIPDRSEKNTAEFLQFHQPMTTEGWDVHLLISTQEAKLSALMLTAVVTSILTVLLLIGIMLLQRRARLIQMLEFRERARLTLEQKVEERTSDLQKSNEELRQTQSELVQAGKLAALGQMSTALSHEFNQPLTAIRTYAENANAFMDRGMEDKASDNLSRILILTERMAQLSKRLSNFARKPNDSVRSVRLTDALNEALGLLQARIEQSDVKITTSVSEDLWFLGGQVRLQHVLMNLIVNAMDEMANSPDRRIRISAQKNAQNKIILKVADSGSGVSDENKEKIFDPFFTTKEVGKGVGLGLSISYNIIRDFGGLMKVEDGEDGIGACFIVELQAANEEVEAK